MEINEAQSIFSAAQQQVATIVVGKPMPIKLAFTALLANGHVLFEDIPGVGKTTLVQAIAKTLAMPFSRIQFTPDMLPSDVLGTSIFNRATNAFEFQRGPIFTSILLADEINRATPRTQAALLEAMGERRVTTDGHTLSWPRKTRLTMREPIPCLKRNWIGLCCDCRLAIPMPLLKKVYF